MEAVTQYVPVVPADARANSPLEVLRSLNFFAPAAVMSGWAIVMLHIIASGHINRLLSPMFRGYVWAAAALLFGLSVLYLLFFQPNPAGAESGVRTNSFRQLGRWAVLLVPLLAATMLSPSALSNTTLANRDPMLGAAPMPSWNGASEESAKRALDADPNQPAPIEVTDLLTIAKSPQQVAAFDGHKVRTVALFSTQAGSPKAVRWIMWCCAADALPASVPLTGSVSGNWKDGQWVEVTGTAQFPAVQGHVTPQLAVDSIASAPEPDEPFLSP
jgi:putative membrane protein